MVIVPLKADELRLQKCCYHHQNSATKVASPDDKMSKCKNKSVLTRVTTEKFDANKELSVAEGTVNCPLLGSKGRIHV